jgi:exosortase/archaeosortase
MTVPVIYVANQFRNIAIIFMTERNITLGISDDAFNLAHNWVGKGFSFLVLIGIVIYTFKVLPEALDNLFTLFDLHKRDKGKVSQGKLVLPKNEKPTEDKDGKEESGLEKTD